LTELNANYAKKNLPLVTIGVCVRNAASTIREAIESIIAQDYPHELMEVIFVDDGSKDETLSIVKRYAAKMDMRVKIFHHEWRGLGYSRNIVVKNASGKYIIWVDGDMLLSKDFVKKLVRFMEKNPRVAIAKGAHGLLYTKSLVAFLENILFMIYDFEEKDGVLRRLPGTGSSIYRLETTKKVGGFDCNLQGVGEDQDIAYRIMLSGWLIKKVHAIFYERHRQTWMALWDEYYWWGEGMSDVLRRHPNLIDLYKMLPLAGFLTGVIYSVKAYKIIKKKVVFLLPFHFTFKFTAWCLGFLNKSMKCHTTTVRNVITK
jgi:biofilm PGA synthesis N-glycosyltransferase PgaC